jgi:hypothetical protein
MKTECDHCKRPFSREVRPGPVLKDDVWLRLAVKYETLCGACVAERATAAGLLLTFSDLRPCAFNLGGGANSWFEVFRDEEIVSECEEWNDARRVLQRTSAEWWEKYGVALQ